MNPIKFNQIHAFLSVGTILPDTRIIPGIFTKNRVDSSELPEGLFRYEVRNAISIEKSVEEQFTGTVLTQIELPVNAEGIVKYEERFHLENVSYERWNRIQNENTFGEPNPKEDADPVITPFVIKKMMMGYKVVKHRDNITDKLSYCPKCQSAYLYSFTRLNEDIKECPFCKHHEENFVIRYKTAVKVIFDDEDYLTSEINTDFEGAKEYYLGKSFESSDETHMQRCIDVQLIKTILPDEDISEIFKGRSTSEGQTQALYLYEKYRNQYNNPLQVLEENLTMFLKDPQKAKDLVEYVKIMTCNRD